MTTLTHGHDRRGRRTAEYSAWAAASNRCLNPQNAAFAYYGARGITFAVEWQGANGFDRFLEHIGPKPSPAHTLDRKDNSRGYEPGNVRWATRSEQMANTRRTRLVAIDGQVRSLKDWATNFGIPYKTVWARVVAGWPAEMALRTPVNATRQKLPIIKPCAKCGADFEPPAKHRRRDQHCSLCRRQRAA